jgi:hypothetical protein
MPPAAVAAVMYGAVAAARATIAHDWPGPIRMGILIFVGAMTYAVLSFAVRRKRTMEVLDFVQSIAISKRS